MVLIVCVDNHNGMMFNQRRQSKDREVRAKILSMSAGSRLVMNGYSAKQFTGEDARFCVLDDLNTAEQNDFCFVENELPSAFEAKTDKLILFRWNRVYPADLHFDIDLSNWNLQTTEDFAGKSHDKITMEVWTK